MESLLQTSAFFHSDAIWCYGELNDTVGIQLTSARRLRMMKVYHIIINSINFWSISILSMLFNARVAVKNVPNCFTSNNFADYEIDESFVATLSPTLMIQWEDMFLQPGIPWLLNLCEYFKSVKIALKKHCQSGLTINWSRGAKSTPKNDNLNPPYWKQPIQVFFLQLRDPDQAICSTQLPSTKA